MSDTIEKFEQWCVVEIMGHKRFAGFVSEQSIGGSSFVRVDVPEIVLEGIGEVAIPPKTLPGFTKLFGASSIYCLTPCTEETARQFAKSLRTEAFSRYELPRLPAPPQVPYEDPNDDNDDGDDCDDPDDDGGPW